ncbi:hypothetical protein niasHS_018082 [Heterodera schachtii]|uniref:Ubiquitin-like domain-containing protein n=1 Tax=Heterodera schachtii TaxID=97005 RepID=A0ABD2HSD1_HETSC
MNHFGVSLLPICLSAGLTIMLMLMLPSSTDGMEITVKSSKIIPKASNFLTKLIMRAGSSSQNERTTISVDLKSEQTVADLKQAIKKETGIPPEQQLIRHNSPSGEVLKDGETLENGGLEKADVFLSFGEFEIRVHNGTEMFASRVDKTDTVATLKKAIKERFGIPVEKQVLRRSNRRKYDNILEDCKTMDRYQQILDGKETVYLFIIFTLNMETDAPWIIMETKNKIKDNAFTVEVEGTDSVLRLKQKIGNSIGRYFSHDLQTLRQTDGLALKDHQTMDFYKIKEGQTILLTFHEFEIVIKYGMKRFSVNVKQSDTVETLKKRIENIKLFGNIPHEKQALITWQRYIAGLRYLRIFPHFVAF